MASSREMERRRYPWLSETFPVLERGVNAQGEAFERKTVLDNFSAGGLYVCLTRRVKPGAKLFAVIRPSTNLRSAAPAPCVAVHGEAQPDGRYGAGVAFTHCRFL